MKNDDWHFFVIYRNPSDYPGKFVVRERVLRREHERQVEYVARIGCVCDSLAEARESIPHREQYILIPQSCDDDPVIAETWI